MYNDNIAIENFIAYCDDMMIAEEGLFSKIKNKINQRKELKRKKELENKTERMERNEKFTEMLQDEGIDFLKKYISKAEFKSKYKDKLYMISIEATDYGDPYSIQITEYQDGVDWDKLTEWEKHNPKITNESDADYWKRNPYTNKDWYNELIDECISYLQSKYSKEMIERGISLSSGDGDEGNIYIIVN